MAANENLNQDKKTMQNPRGRFDFAWIIAVTIELQDLFLLCDPVELRSDFDFGYRTALAHINNILYT